MHDVLIEKSKAPIPVRALFDDGLDKLGDPFVRGFAETQRFKAKRGEVLLVPGADGKLALVLAGLGKAAEVDPWFTRALPGRLPGGDYTIEAPKGAPSADLMALGWALGGYAFDRYRKREERERARLVAPKGCALEEVRRLAAACALVRDMVNTPAGDMGPRQIETVAREIAEAHKAKLTVVAGDALHDQDYPLVHAVGRAASAERAPRIIEISWNAAKKDLPLVAVVGKGVVFDSGGLDIKSAAGMRLMKKDMGGAAHALALGRLIMQAGLKVRLVVLVPAVENAISGDAFRPGDVIVSRKGLSVEIGNTDAEGRLILADALARAGELKPDLTLDFATLTGAARVALGPQLPPFYTHDDRLAGEIAKASERLADPVWRMPLWSGYREAVEAEIADLRNDSAEWAQAGSVTAALFLERFAPETGAWVHFDVFAWNPKARPGWPTGGEAQAIRAAFSVLQARYG
jgi:leucyl aminopeptidase